MNESGIQESLFLSEQDRATGALVLVEDGTIFSGLTRGLIHRNKGPVTHMDFDDIRLRLFPSSLSIALHG